MQKKRKITYLEDGRTVSFAVGQRVCKGKARVSSVEHHEFDNRDVAKIYIKDKDNSEAEWKSVNLPHSSDFSFENDFTKLLDI